MLKKINGGFIIFVRRKLDYEEKTTNIMEWNFVISH